MKIKDFKRMHPQGGDIFVFSTKEFGTRPQQQALCQALGPIFHGKRIGIIFVEDVHDELMIYGQLAAWMETQLDMMKEELKKEMGIEEEGEDVIVCEIPKKD